jgi:hypothetical protein
MVFYHLPSLMFNFSFWCYFRQVFFIVYPRLFTRVFWNYVKFIHKCRITSWTTHLIKIWIITFFLIWVRLVINIRTTFLRKRINFIVYMIFVWLVNATIIFRYFYLLCLYRNYLFIWLVWRNIANLFRNHILIIRIRHFIIWKSIWTKTFFGIIWFFSN